MILFAFDTVGFAGHARAAAAAYKNTGKQIDSFLVGCRSCIKVTDTLYKVKIMLERCLNTLNLNTH